MTFLSEAANPPPPARANQPQPRPSARARPAPRRCVNPAWAGPGAAPAAWRPGAAGWLRLLWIQCGSALWSPGSAAGYPSRHETAPARRQKPTAANRFFQARKKAMNSSVPMRLNCLALALPRTRSKAVRTLAAGAATGRRTTSPLASAPQNQPRCAGASPPARARPAGW